MDQWFKTIVDFAVPGFLGVFVLLVAAGLPRIRRFDMHGFPAMKATFTYWKESDGKYFGYRWKCSAPLGAAERVNH